VIGALFFHANKDKRARCIVPASELIWLRIEALSDPYAAADRHHDYWLGLGFGCAGHGAAVTGLGTCANVGFDFHFHLLVKRAKRTIFRQPYAVEFGSMAGLRRTISD
jgi:hypothetical protein